MASLTDLKSKAIETTFRRGHMMQFTAPWHGERNSLQNGECINCKRYVQVNTNPMPNEIDIVGDALAIECEAE